MGIWKQAFWDFCDRRDTWLLRELREFLDCWELVSNDFPPRRNFLELCELETADESTSSAP